MVEWWKMALRASFGYFKLVEDTPTSFHSSREQRYPGYMVYTDFLCHQVVACTFLENSISNGSSFPVYAPTTIYFSFFQGLARIEIIKYTNFFINFKLSGSIYCILSQPYCFQIEIPFQTIIIRHKTS